MQFRQHQEVGVRVEMLPDIFTWRTRIVLFALVSGPIAFHSATPDTSACAVMIPPAPPSFPPYVSCLCVCVHLCVYACILQSVENYYQDTLAECGFISVVRVGPVHPFTLIMSCEDMPCAPLRTTER